MKIALFGPPGIGKSTIVKQLISLNYNCYDCEIDWPKSSELTFELEQYQLIGTAGLQFNDPRLDNFYKILLYLPQDLYEKRRMIRDDMYPEKASQNAHIIDDWILSSSYDMILLANSNVVTILRILLDY